MEYFKVNYKDDDYYLIPTVKTLTTFNEPDEWPFSFNSLIVKCYNFTIDNFFRYIISKFNAQVKVEKEWPYFFFTFLNKNNADEFCKEVNSRMKNLFYNN